MTAPAALDSLTPRQAEVARLIAEGHSTKEIAYALGISTSVVRVHISAVYDLLGVDSRAGLTRRLYGWPPPALPSLPGLSQRQAEVVVLVAEGQTNREIAYRLGITEQTVKNHVTGALRALGVRNRVELARRLWKSAREETA